MSPLFKEEESHIHSEINGQQISAAFDGTPQLGESLYVILTKTDVCSNVLSEYSSCTGFARILRNLLGSGKL